MDIPLLAVCGLKPDFIDLSSLIPGLSTSLKDCFVDLNNALCALSKLNYIISLNVELIITIHELVKIKLNKYCLMV